MSSLFLTGGRVVDPAGAVDGPLEVLIEEGKVAALGEAAAARVQPDTPRLDVTGLVVCPGLIDLHVHLREPGQAAKETLASGTEAAARGGFATVVCMPNTSPAIDTPSTVAWVRQRAAEVGRVNVLVAGAITRGLAGEELAPIGSLKKAGVVAITDDGHCVQNTELMRRALEYATMFDLLVMDHCQEYTLTADGVMHEGRVSLMLGLGGWPAEAEELIVARNILLAERTGARVHCQHLSAAGSVRLLREARLRGLPVSGEACPHHFTLTDTAVAGSEAFWAGDGAELYPGRPATALPPWPAFDTRLKMNPPVRTAADRAALLEGLADGTIEVIASDHAPHCNFEKEVEFDRAPFGITGLETELALSLMRLYHTGRLSLAGLLAKFTCNPARLLGLADVKGALRPGMDGDVTVLDPDREWVWEPAATASLARNSPFYGWPLRGKALATIVAGRVVWQDAQWVPKPPPGRRKTGRSAVRC
jgi:dihydroorotase